MVQSCMVVKHRRIAILFHASLRMVQSCMVVKPYCAFGIGYNPFENGAILYGGKT